MQVDFNPSVNQSRPNFKAHFNDDSYTKNAINKLITWSPEKVLVANYIIKKNIKADDTISLLVNTASAAPVFSIRNERLRRGGAFGYHREFLETPIDRILKIIKEREGLTDEKDFKVDKATEDAYYVKAKKFVAKLVSRHDRKIATLEQNIQKLEEQLKTLKKERLEIVTEGIQKEIYKVAKKVK